VIGEGDGQEGWRAVGDVLSDPLPDLLLGVVSRSLSDEASALD
jgi:hypothetical protein